jgi:glucose/arabinose dehydrogenase
VTPGDPVPVTGQKNLAWDQAASSLAELSGVGYNLYVDGSPTKFDSVPCSDGATAGMFVCQLPLPSMVAGPHTLQLTSFYTATPTTESAKSAALQIVVTALVASVEVPSMPQRTSPSAPADAGTAGWPAGLIRVATGVDRPADLAFTPDGRLWIAERSGHVRVMHEDGMVSEPALTLDPRIPDGAVLSLAPDPRFTENHFVFTIYTERLRSGTPAFAIARFREVGDTLADRVVILDNVPASADPRASLRFGLDGKLYAAFDDAGDARLPDDLASFNGKTLRLNPDGTTPDDAPAKSPVFSSGLSSPRGLAWHRATTRLWTADASSVGPAPWTPAPEGIAIVEDELFVASQAGLARAQLQRSGSPQLGAPRDIIRNVAVRAIAVAPSGVVYVATDTAIGRLP